MENEDGDDSLIETSSDENDKNVSNQANCHQKENLNEGNKSEEEKTELCKTSEEDPKEGPKEDPKEDAEEDEEKELEEKTKLEEGNSSLLSRLEMEVEEASKEEGIGLKEKQIQNGTIENKIRKRVRIKLPATDEEEEEENFEIDTVVESGEVCYLFEESKFDSEPDLTKIPSPKRVRVLRIKERRAQKPQVIFYPRPEVSKVSTGENQVDSDQEKKEDEEAERVKIEKLKKRLEKRRGRRRMFRDRKRYWLNMIFKAVQYFMIAVSIISIPVDLWKLVDGVIKSATALDGPTALEYVHFYSATIGTHAIGAVGAIESQVVITVASRLASTWLYQVDQSSKNSSEGPPSDPKQIQKWIKEKVPRHRLPKGYKFPKEDESTQTNTMNDDMMGMGGYPGMDGMGMDGMYPGMGGMGGMGGMRGMRGMGMDGMGGMGSKSKDKKSKSKSSEKKKKGSSTKGKESSKKTAKKSTSKKASSKSSKSGGTKSDKKSNEEKKKP